MVAGMLYHHIWAFGPARILWTHSACATLGPAPPKLLKPTCIGCQPLAQKCPVARHRDTKKSKTDDIGQGTQTHHCRGLSASATEMHIRILCSSLDSSVMTSLNTLGPLPRRFKSNSSRPSLSPVISSERSTV